MAQYSLNDLIDFFSKKNELDSNLIDETREQYHEAQGDLLQSRNTANENAKNLANEYVKNLAQPTSQNIEPDEMDKTISEIESPLEKNPYYNGPMPKQFAPIVPKLPSADVVDNLLGLNKPQEPISAAKVKIPHRPQLQKSSKQQEPVQTSEESPEIPEESISENLEQTPIEAARISELPIDMQSALIQANKNRQQANTIDAISQIITGMAGLKPSLAPLEYKGEAAKMLREQADIPVQQVKELKISEKQDIDLQKAKYQLEDESQQRDPNSDISKALRTFILDQGKTAGMTKLVIPEGLSYNALQKMYGHITDVFNAKLKSDTLKESIRQRQQEKQFKLSDQITAQDDKAAKSLQKDLDPNMNSRGNMARNQARVDAAERLEALAVEKDGQFVNLTPQQMNELAAGLDTLISSNPSISGREHLTPESKSKWIANRLQWLTDNPQGADQIAFSMNMVDTIRREKEVAQDQIRRVQKERLAAHKGLKQRNPNLYNEIVSNYGITDSEDTETIIDPKGIARQIPKSQVEAALKAGGKRPK